MKRTEKKMSVCTAQKDMKISHNWSLILIHTLGFPGGSDSKGSICNARDLGLIPGLGRCLGEGSATHSSILTWRILWTEEPTVYGVAKNGKQQQLTLTQLPL